MKNPAKSVAKGLLRLTSPRAPIQSSGETREFISQNAIEPIQKQYNAWIKKVWSGKDSITKTRAKSIDEASWLGKPYRFLTGAGGTAVDSIDRLILEEGVSTASDAVHSATRIATVSLGKLTGVKVTSGFQSRDYISTSNLSGNTYDKNRPYQALQGVKDIWRGVVYGNANQSEDANGYRASTGVFGLAKTIAVDYWSQGLTQTVQNTTDSLFGSANRAVSGVKNTATGVTMTPFWAADKITTKLGGFLAPKAKAKWDETDIRSYNPFGFNPSNFNNRLDDEGEFKTYWQRSKSVFKKNN